MQVAGRRAAKSGTQRRSASVWDGSAFLGEATATEASRTYFTADLRPDPRLPISPLEVLHRPATGADLASSTSTSVSGMTPFAFSAILRGMVMSRGDMQLVVHRAIAHSANALGIGVDEDDPLASLSAIEAKNQAIFHALDNLLNSLAAWYKIHQDIEATGSAGHLNAQKVSEFIRRIDDRKAAAETLVELLKGGRD
jgi:hypothetical protein